MDDLWAKVGDIWASYKQPLRPGDVVAQQMRELLNTDDADVLLLGVTPEFAQLGRTLTAVDVAPAMIGAVWPGDTGPRRAILGDWLDLPVTPASMDAVIGDGVLTVIGGHGARLSLFEQIARALRPEGRAAIRLFAQPEGGDSIDAIIADGLGGKIATTSELVMRLFFSMDRSAPDYLLHYRDVYAALETAFPDRGPMMEACGFTHEDFRFIEVYAASETSNSWSPTGQSIAEAGRHFGEVSLIPTSGYPRSEWCPILLLAEPKL